MKIFIFLIFIDSNRTIRKHAHNNNNVNKQTVPLHISHNFLDFLEPKFLIDNAVRSEVRPPLEALEEHLEGILDPEVSRPEKLEKNHVGLLVVVQQRDSPDGGGVGGGGLEALPEVLQGFLFGGFEVGDEVGVFAEGVGPGGGH